MLIDWFTVLAQLINFLILIFLLKFFLYGPITRAMEERRRKIASQMTAAEQARQEAEESTKTLAQERQALEETRDQLMARARSDVEQWRDEAMEAARREIDLLRRSWLQLAEDEKNLFLKKLKGLVVHQVVSVSRKALADLAGGDLEGQLIETFLQKVGSDLDMLSKEKAAPVSPVLHVRTGFTLDAARKQRLQEGLGQLMPQVKAIELTVDPELGFGLRLTAGNRKIEWNLNRYMGDLETEILRSFAPAPGRTT